MTNEREGMGENKDTEGNVLHIIFPRARPSGSKSEAAMPPGQVLLLDSARLQDHREESQRRFIRDFWSIFELNHLAQTRSFKKLRIVLHLYEALFLLKKKTIKKQNNKTKAMLGSLVS